MNTIKIDSNSWHAKLLGMNKYYVKDFCSYLRGLLLILFLLAILWIVLLSDIFWGIILPIYYYFHHIVFSPTIIACWVGNGIFLISGGLALSICWITHKIDIYKNKNKYEKNFNSKNPGIVKLYFKKFKEKVCFLIEVV